MAWTTIYLRVTTPLFNGGADGDAGVRIPSLRGAMRFWFRALAGIGVGNNLPALQRLEGHVFGTTDHSSPVKLRLAGAPAVNRPGKPAWCRGDEGRWIVYLLGQSLGDLRKTEVIRPYVDAGQPITVQVRFGDDPDVAALVLAALWLTCTYGGLGARTRRGFGGLRIVDADGDLPAPWTPDGLRTPGIEAHHGIRYLWPIGPIGACMKPLTSVAAALTKETKDGQRAPVPFALPANEQAAQFPVLSKSFTVAGLSGGEHFTDWTYLLAHAGEQLRHFRASRSAPEARYSPKIKTPEWLEVVHGADNHFGLGALGLPVVYKEGNVVNAVSAGAGSESLRRASPLWLRPVGEGRVWRLLSFAFQGEFLPPTASVLLQRRGRRVKNLAVGRSDVVARTSQWVNNLADDVDLAC